MIGLPPNPHPPIDTPASVAVVQARAADGTPRIAILVQDGTGEHVAHLDLDVARTVGEALIKGADAGRLLLVHPGQGRFSGVPTAS